MLCSTIRTHYSRQLVVYRTIWVVPCAYVLAVSLLNSRVLELSMWWTISQQILIRLQFTGLFNLLCYRPDLIYQGIVHVFLSDSCDANPRVRGPTVSFMFWSFAWCSMLAWWTRFCITATMMESAFKYLRICVMLLVYIPCRFVGVSFWLITVLSLCSTD